MNVVCSHVNCVQMPAPNLASLARRSVDAVTLGRIEHNYFSLESFRICLKPFLFWRQTRCFVLIAKAVD